MSDFASRNLPRSTSCEVWLSYFQSPWVLLSSATEEEALCFGPGLAVYKSWVIGKFFLLDPLVPTKLSRAWCGAPSSAAFTRGGAPLSHFSLNRHQCKISLLPCHHQSVGVTYGRMAVNRNSSLQCPEKQLPWSLTVSCYLAAVSAQKFDL